MVWRKQTMPSSGLGSSRRLITSGGVILGTDGCTNGSIVGENRYKYHNESIHGVPAGSNATNVGQPFSASTSTGAGMGTLPITNMATPQGHKAKQQEIFDQISKQLSSTKGVNKNKK
jgi:hypothetical protein